MRVCATILLVFVIGCGSASVVTSNISSPLARGVYSGTAECEIRTTNAWGQVSTQMLPVSVTFEINEDGIPIVEGREIQVGRTVAIGDFAATYTRIEPTAQGIVWHANLTYALGGVTADGAATYELRPAPGTGALEYRATITTIDSAGNSGNQFCEFILNP